MNLIYTFLFAVILGTGFYLAGEGIVEWNDTKTCTIIKYSRNMTGIYVHVGMSDKTVCYEDTKQVLPQNEDYIPINYSYPCKLDRLSLIAQNTHEVKTQIELGVILIIIGCFPLMFRDKKKQN